MPSRDITTRLPEWRPRPPRPHAVASVPRGTAASLRRRRARLEAHGLRHLEHVLVRPEALVEQAGLHLHLAELGGHLLLARFLGLGVARGVTQRQQLLLGARHVDMLVMPEQQIINGHLVAQTLHHIGGLVVARNAVKVAASAIHARDRRHDNPEVHVVIPSHDFHAHPLRQVQFDDVFLPVGVRLIHELTIAVVSDVGVHVIQAIR
mmetsp:Transcript_19281/g.56045  ORF Transcript_19281/g.56045 Transcript_19281/m.56045 type:complete len:207 (-) Transcript_19281:502-1122(-)